MLPIDRTWLQKAALNQVPEKEADPEANYKTLKGAYDYVDELNQQADNHAGADILPHKDRSVTRDKIALRAVGTAELGDNSVTPVKIPNQSIDATKFVPGALTNETQNALRIIALEAEKATKSEVSAKADRSYVDMQLAEKVNQSDLDETNENVDSKRDKSVKIASVDLDTSSDANKIKLVNLSEEVQTAMAGTTPITATVANNSLTKEKYANKSVTDYKTDFVTTGKNLYDGSKLKAGTWANWSTGVIGALVGWNCSDYIPVLPSAQYATRYNASRAYFKSDYSFISGGDQTTAFTTPANCAYVIINFQDANVNGQQLEQGSAFTSYEPYYNKFKNENPKGSVPLDGTITIDKFYSDHPVNLFNKNAVEVGYYIASDGTKTAYGSNIGGISDYIPVKPNETYTFTNGTDTAGQNKSGAWYDKNKNWISSVTFSQSPFPTVVTKTAPSNAYYFRLNYVTSHIDNVMFVKGELYPSQYYPYGIELPWIRNANVDPTTDDKKTIANYSRFYGGIANVLGDSITYGSGLSDLTKRYPDVLKTKLGLKECRNYGINATLITHEDGRTNAFVDRYSAMDNDADLIIVFGGTNDYYVGSGAFGAENSTNTREFYGALNTLIQGLINKYTTKTILFVTPYNSFYVHSSDAPNTATGVNLKGYRDAIFKRCEYYGIPVLDLFSMSGIDAAHNVASRNAYTTDGLHPNVAGHELIANRLAGFVKAL